MAQVRQGHGFAVGFGDNRQAGDTAVPLFPLADEWKEAPADQAESGAPLPGLRACGQGVGVRMMGPEPLRNPRSFPGARAI